MAHRIEKKDRPGRHTDTTEEKTFRPRSDAVRHALACVESLNALTLTSVELRALSSLMSYVANNQKRDERTVQAIIESRYNIVDIAILPRRDYEDAIRFLADLRFDEILN